MILTEKMTIPEFIVFMNNPCRTCDSDGYQLFGELPCTQCCPALDEYNKSLNNGDLGY